jgi:hypothetical protein
MCVKKNEKSHLLNMFIQTILGAQLGKGLMESMLFHFFLLCCVFLSQ